MEILAFTCIALALCLLLLYVRAEQRRRRRAWGLAELTVEWRHDLIRQDVERLRDFDEALQLEAPAWTDTRFYDVRRRP